MNYDPSAVGRKGSVFGFPYSKDEADVVLIPVPWDVTVSFGDGTRDSPSRILDMSTQLDFSLPQIKAAHTYPVFMDNIDFEVEQKANSNRSKAVKLIEELEKDGELSEANIGIQNEINEQCQRMNAQLKKKCKDLLDTGKLVAIIGGDHSTPLGLLEALAENGEEFGVLQIDAHMDLRESYEGFIYSHASIMRNAMEIPEIEKLVQVGIRDYCEEEEQYAIQSKGKVVTHFDEELVKKKWDGAKWGELTETIVADLPNKVYISFDMDGLDPSLCPNTGTPVPGGLSFFEAVCLIEAVVRSGRKIIGFDISECGNHDWDANVAARILFRLCTYVGVSRNRLTLI